MVALPLNVDSPVRHLHYAGRWHSHYRNGRERLPVFWALGPHFAERGRPSSYSPTAAVNVKRS